MTRADADVAARYAADLAERLGLPPVPDIDWDEERNRVSVEPPEGAAPENFCCSLAQELGRKYWSFLDVWLDPKSGKVMVSDKEGEE